MDTKNSALTVNDHSLGKNEHYIFARDPRTIEFLVLNKADSGSLFSSESSFSMKGLSFEETIEVIGV